MEVDDGRGDGVLGLGVLKLSQSSSTASIYPESLLLAFSSCPVAVHIYRDTRTYHALVAVYMVDTPHFL